MAESEISGIRRRKRRRSILSSLPAGISVLIFGIGMLALILLDSGRYGADLDDILSYAIIMLLIVNVLAGWTLMLAATSMGGQHAHSHDRDRLLVLRNRLFPVIVLLHIIRILAIGVFLAGAMLTTQLPIDRFAGWLREDAITRMVFLSLTVILVLYQTTLGPWIRTSANLRLGSWIARSAARTEKPWRAVATRLMLQSFGLFSLIWVFAILGLTFLTLTDPFWNTPVNWAIFSRFAFLTQLSSSTEELILWVSILLLMTLHSIGQGIIIGGIGLFSARKQGKNSA